tara:strand:+ start:2281 stop:2811 length:531 start_codon:yes stop_codon:yes gene_type:complete
MGPIQQILFDKLVELGRLDPNPTEQTIQTINEISNSDALKLLRSLPGTGPTIQKAGGGMMSIDEITKPIGMAGGGDWKEKLLGSKDDNATLNAMKDHPFQTALYLDLGFDKMFDLLSMLPMMKDGGAVGMNEGGLHPLVEFKEIWEAYKLDGGELEFKPYFDMLQEELKLMDYDKD